MKKSTYIAAITTGLGLVGLWSLFGKRDAKEAAQDIEPIAEEDDFISEVIVPRIGTKNPKAAYGSDTKDTKIVKGILERRNQGLPLKKRRKRSRSFQAEGHRLSRFLHQNMIKPEPNSVAYKTYYKHLQDTYEVTQIRLTNTTDIWRDVCLWGGNNDLAITTLTQQDIILQATQVETQYTQDVGVHPQGIVVNPANTYTYVANQLSNDITILDGEGTVVKTITLVPDIFPGYNSPVALAVNTRRNTPNYGKVYVVGSVANTVSVLSEALTLEKTIAVGTRPVAIAFNPINAKLYVCNIVDDTVSVIDTETETVEAILDVGKHPRAVAIHPERGDIYVANSGANTISIFDSNQILQETITDVGDTPVGLVVPPEVDRLFVVSTGSNEVSSFDLSTTTLINTIPVGDAPYSIVYNSINEFIYVGNRNGNTLSVLSKENEDIGSIQRDQVNIGLAFDPNTGSLITSDTGRHTVTAIGFIEEESVTVNEAYESKQEEFKFNPAWIKHVKFVLSGKERFGVLTREIETVTGSLDQIPISFSSYNSPQNFCNVSEVFSLENTILDGKHRWKFKIAPQQTITILIYYYQLDMHRVYEGI